MAAHTAAAVTKDLLSKGFNSREGSEPDNSTILRRRLDWMRLVNANFIKESELGLIRDYDQQPKEDQDNIIAERGLELVRVLVKTLDNVSSQEEYVEYVIALIDQLLAVDRSRSAIFHQLSDSGFNPATPFLRLLYRNYKPFIIGRACNILAILLSSGHRNHDDIIYFVNWLCERASQVDAKLPYLINALQIMLRNPDIQMLFWKNNGIQCLMQHFRANNTNTQIIYQVAFCLWVLSFNPEVIQQLAPYQVVKSSVEILKVVQREKVVRVIMLLLKNLLGKNTYNEEMIEHGLPAVISTIERRQYTDNELMDDVNEVHEALQKNIRILSSFEMYEKELLSGNLEWGPVHTEKFWRENINRFDANDYQYIRMITDLLDSPSPAVKAIACFDIGEIARLHPFGKRIVSRLGAKEKVLSLLNFDHPEVQRHALLCIQKIMVNNWEFLSQSR